MLGLAVQLRGCSVRKWRVVGFGCLGFRCLWECWWSCFDAKQEVVQLYNFFDSAHLRNPSFAPAAAMTTVPLAQARQQLSGLLDRIQAGECVVISRYGKPVARLIPELAGQAGAELWLERLRRLHQEAGHGAV